MNQAAITAALTEAGLDPEAVADLVRRALAEDLAGGRDVTTTATIAADQQGRADVVPRSAGIVAGLPVAALVFQLASDGRVTVVQPGTDGALVQAGEVLLTATGPVRDLLTAERTALNLLTHLSGVATLTRLWVAAVDGTEARIRDTRKTMPGLRALEKYAVRCGGGVNHRMSLSDAALIKDNHVEAAGSVTRAFQLVRDLAPDLPVEVEVDTVDQCAEAIAAGADLILLDNMSLPDLKACVALAAERRHAGQPVKLEASGGLSLGVAAEVAATGVDYLAVGALTHSAPALDLGLDLRPADAAAADPVGPDAAGEAR